jgi:uncharacterized membrane protein YbhN (UPF0104 family)
MREDEKEQIIVDVLHYIWKLLRPWLPWIAVIALLYLLVASVHPAALLAAAGRIRWEYCVPLAGAFFLYLILRAIRWHLLMKPLGAPNSLLDSLLLFTGAQAAVLVPAGQLLLPVLQKSQYGTLIRRSAATVMVQELVFGILLIPAALPDLPFYQNAGWFLLVAFLFSFLAGTLLLQRHTAQVGLRLMQQIPFLRAHVPKFEELRITCVLVARTREAILGSALDWASIAAMGTAFYIALVALNAPVGWVGGLATFAFGASAGTVSALPGGLGANEDISTLLLVRLGMAPGPAGVATLLFRAETLVLGTVVGWLVLFIFRDRFGIHPSFRGLLAVVRKGEEEVVTEIRKIEREVIQHLGGREEPAHQSRQEEPVHQRSPDKETMQRSSRPG